MQLSVKDTVCAVLGIVTDTEPEASVEVPLHPLNAGLLVRVQLSAPVNPEVDQLTVVVPLTLTEAGAAMIETEGVPAGVAVLTVAVPSDGLMAIALTVLLSISGCCLRDWPSCATPLMVHTCADAVPTRKADPSINNIVLLRAFIKNPLCIGTAFTD